jgi:hypothetical protein
MKKLSIIFFFFGFALLPFFLKAGSYEIIKPKEGSSESEYKYEVEYQGLVPCGKCVNIKSGEYPGTTDSKCGTNQQYVPCQICHIFIVISNVIKFFYSELLWPLLGVLISILGLMLLLSEIHPVAFVGEKTVFEGIGKVKEGIKSTAFALFFLLSLWFLINLFFMVMGVAEWTGLREWFKISCTIKESPLAPERAPAPTPSPPTPSPPTPSATSGCPVNGGSVNSPFGCRYHPTNHCWRMHNGIDIVSSDKNIYAVNSGEVIAAGNMGDCGIGVKIRDENGYTSVYCHLGSTNVAIGRKVEQGAQIGTMDSTGASTGDHLHFGIMDSQGNYQNPENFIAHCNYPKTYDPKNYDWSGEKCSRDSDTRCE